MYKSTKDYQFEALGTLAAFGAPWQACSITMRTLAMALSSEQIMAAVHEQRDIFLADEANKDLLSQPHFPQSGWITFQLAQFGGEHYQREIYLSLLKDMMYGLTNKGELESAEALARELLEVHKKIASDSVKAMRSKVSKEPADERSAYRNEILEEFAEYKPTYIQRALIDILKRQGRFEEAMQIIQETKFKPPEFLPEKALPPEIVRAHQYRLARDSSVGSLVGEALNYGLDFDEADILLQKAFAKLDQPSSAEQPAIRYAPDATLIDFERIVSLYLRNHCFRSAEGWLSAKLVKFDAALLPRRNLCQEYIDAIYTAGCHTGLGNIDLAEKAYRKMLQVTEEGAVFDPLLGQIISLDWMVKSRVDFAIFLHMNGRSEEALQQVNGIQDLGLPYDRLLKAILQPQLDKLSDWCRWLPHGYASAGLFASDDELISYAVAVLVNVLKDTSLLVEPADRLRTYSVGAMINKRANKLEQAKECFVQAIALADPSHDANLNAGERFQPDLLLNLLEEFSDLLHQTNCVDEGRVVRNRAEEIRTQFFREP